MKICYLDSKNEFGENQETVERTFQGKVNLYESFLSLKEDYENVKSSDILILNIDLVDINDDFLNMLMNERLQFLALSDHKSTETEQGKHFLSQYPDVKIIEKPIVYKNFLLEIQKLTGDELEKASESHKAVLTDRFLALEEASVDIYLKLSTDKFVKVLKKGDSYDEEFLNKYKDKGVDKFYILSSDFDLFRKSLLTELSEMDSNSDITDVIGVQKFCLSAIHETVQKLGISPETIQEVDELTESSLKIIENSSDLKSVFEKFRENEDFFYAHSLFNAYLCGGIIQEISWDTESTFQKLINACLLHDLTLENEMLHTDIETASNDNLSWKEIKKIKNHPMEMAEIVRLSDKIPPDVDNIILNHHERPNGAGFPRGLDSKNIMPLACVFIIAEVFIEQLGNEEITDLTIKRVIKKMEEDFSQGNFQTPFEGLKKLVA